ncbi:MAG: hypothetical protein ABIG94_09990 [Pseudomonadota bacterium]
MARSIGTALPGCPFQAARHFFLDPENLLQGRGGWHGQVCKKGEGAAAARQWRQARLPRRVTSQARRRKTGIFIVI